jgi:hypothetical protein
VITFAVVAAGLVAYLVYVSYSNAAWAVFERGKSTMFGLLAITATVTAICVFFGYFTMKQKLINRVKYSIIHLAARKGMSEEEAAKKLGIGTWLVKDSLKELKKEHVIE